MAHNTSTRCMPRESSDRRMTASESAGSKNDGDAAGFELLAATEQFRAAGPTLVDTLGLGVGVLTGERPLGAGAAQDRELVRAELLAPLVVGELHLGSWSRHASTLAMSRTTRKRASPDIMRSYAFGASAAA